MPSPIFPFRDTSWDPFSPVLVETHLVLVVPGGAVARSAQRHGARAPGPFRRRDPEVEFRHNLLQQFGGAFRCEVTALAAHAWYATHLRPCRALPLALPLGTVWLCSCQSFGSPAPVARRQRRASQPVDRKPAFQQLRAFDGRVGVARVCFLLILRPTPVHHL